MDFSYIDLIILIPVVYGIYKGFTKGIILSLTTLIGLILGIYGGVKFSHLTSNYLFEEHQIDIPLLAFALTFLLIMVGMHLLGKLLSKFADILALGLINNLAGAIFGAAKAVLILAVVLLFFENINQKFQLVDTEEVAKSELYGFVKQTSDIVFPHFEELKNN